MAIEIKELVIRASVKEPIERIALNTEPALTRADFDRIVDACVRRVTHIVGKSRER